MLFQAWHWEKDLVVVAVVYACLCAWEREKRIYTDLKQKNANKTERRMKTENMYTLLSILDQHLPHKWHITELKAFVGRKKKRIPFWSIQQKYYFLCRPSMNTHGIFKPGLSGALALRSIQSPKRISKTMSLNVRKQSIYITVRKLKSVRV